MRLEEIDLAELAQKVRTELGEGEPIGYLRGKSVLRDIVQRLLDCSYLEAEELVDTLELRGYFQFDADTSKRARAFAHWDVDPSSEL